MQIGASMSMKRALVRAPLPLPLRRSPLSWTCVFHRRARWPSRPLSPAPVVNTSPDGFTAGTALGLSSRTTEAIIRGEFISFSLLLAELAAGSPAFSAHSLDVAFDRDLADETFSLAQDRDSGSFNLIRTSSSAKPRVTDLHSWLQAWTAYLIVRSTASPDLTSQLLAYQRTIVEAAAMYRPAAWLNYDVAFRRQASANSSTRWDAIALDLWTKKQARASDCGVNKANYRTAGKTAFGRRYMDRRLGGGNVPTRYAGDLWPVVCERRRSTWHRSVNTHAMGSWEGSAAARAMSGPEQGD